MTFAVSIRSIVENIVVDGDDDRIQHDQIFFKLNVTNFIHYSMYNKICNIFTINRWP